MKKFSVVIGAQWGDEGKGKLTNILSNNHDYCVRFQGGDNAGHTIVKNKKTYKLRILPCGILEEKNVVIGSGVVLNFETLRNEINSLSKDFGSDIKKLIHIDRKATIILPFYKELDTLKEERRHKKVGTTKNGIGIAYEDKSARIALRTEDLLLERNKILTKLEDIRKHYSHYNFDFFKNFSYLMNAKKDFSELIKDTGELLYNEYKNNKSILVEGAQGVLLDNTHGTYPFVTSSCTTSQGVGSGIGMALPKESKIIGVLKAYCTRVGNGPFSTELMENSKVEKFISEVGKEFGVVTGRKRRIGWLNLDEINYANRLNGFTSLALMKIDVLDGLQEVKIKYNNLLYRFSGWDNTRKKHNYEELDENFKKYLNFIEEKTQLKVEFISTSENKKDIIKL